MLYLNSVLMHNYTAGQIVFLGENVAVAFLKFTSATKTCLVERHGSRVGRQSGEEESEGKKGRKEGEGNGRDERRKNKGKSY
jgi:hypothetical protein